MFVDGGMLTGRVQGQQCRFANATWLITIIRILLLMSRFLFLRKVLPNLLLLFTFGLPLFTDNFRNVGIIETRVAGNDGLLVVLPIKDKCCNTLAADQDVRKQRPLSFVGPESGSLTGNDEFGHKE
jgi:hypothetical protein